MRSLRLRRGRPHDVRALHPGASGDLGGWMTATNRWIQVVLGFGFGIWLLVKGLTGL